MSEQQHRPFLGLGQKIKSLREGAKESLVEVSGAVEIDVDTLVEIEHGKQLPSEDILLLLISHFEIEDTEAVHIWEMAGYDKQNAKADSAPTSSNQPVFVVNGFDNRILYSDKIDLSINEAGVVLNFKQGDDAGQTVARIGMSRQQAQATLDLLTQALYPKPVQPKFLPHVTKTDEPQTTQ